MIPSLVYDIGAHNGDDTARYLAQGFQVVAIEADPLLAGELRSRFGDEIREGRLAVVAAGVHRHTGNATFYVSEQTLFSSFCKERATQYGTKATSMLVPLVQFDEVLVEYGVPYYMKIDIEGMDHICLDALRSDDLPVYLSTEIDHRYPKIVRQLTGLGFTGFKLIRQRDHRVASPVTFIQEHLGRLDPHVPDHSSGQFGPDTPGMWLPPALALVQAILFLAYRRVSGATRWHDLHARRS